MAHGPDGVPYGQLFQLLTKENAKGIKMKKIFVLQLMLIIALSAHTTYAFYYRSHVYGPRKHVTKPSEGMKRAGRTGESPEEKQKRIAEEKRKRIAIREAAEKAKTITYSKVEIPEWAVPSSSPNSPASLRFPINREMRIESLCDFVLGRVINLARDPVVLDDDYNMEVVVQLKRPFRLCTRAKLRYSRINHGLYSIKLYSLPQEKMSDEEVLTEVEKMTEAFKKKFGDRFSIWSTFSPDMSRHPPVMSGKTAVWKKHTGQSLCIKAREDVIGRSRTVLKGGTDKSKVKHGWTFSVELVDSVLRDLDLTPPPRKEVFVNGVDVL